MIWWWLLSITAVGIVCLFAGAAMSVSSRLSRAEESEFMGDQM